MFTSKTLKILSITLFVIFSIEFIVPVTSFAQEEVNQPGQATMILTRQAIKEEFSSGLIIVTRVIGGVVTAISVLGIVTNNDPATRLVYGIIGSFLGIPLIFSSPSEGLARGKGVLITSATEDLNKIEELAIEALKEMSEIEKSKRYASAITYIFIGSTMLASGSSALLPGAIFLSLGSVSLFTKSEYENAYDEYLRIK